MKAKRGASGPTVPRDLRRICSTAYRLQLFGHHRLPPLFSGTTVWELALPSRARKFFERKGYFERPAAVAKLTIADLLKTRGLGALSIIEIVEALYRCAESRGAKSPRLARGDARPPRPKLTPDDLRQIRRKDCIPATLYGHRMPPIPPGASLGDLRLTGRALRFFRQSRYVENPAEFAKLTIAELVNQKGVGQGTVADIAEALFRCADLAAGDNRTLDDEVLLWLAPRRHRSRRRIVALRFGIGGHRALTLQAIGTSYGYTRERIRQFVSPRSAPPSSLLRQFEAAVETVSALIPISAGAAEARLVERGLIGRSTTLEIIRRVAQLLGREPGFIVQGDGRQRRALPVPAPTTGPLQAFLVKNAHGSPIMQTAHVLSQWNRSAPDPAALTDVEQAVESLARCHWLDPASGWFWLDRGDAALRLRIERALMAARQLTIEELAAATWRGPRAKDWVRPPLTVFRELCRQLPECRLQGERVRTARPSQTRGRESTETKLIEFLRRQNRVCTLDEIKRFAVIAEIGAALLTNCLHGSPGIKRYGPQRYGVPGIQPGPG